MADFYSILAKAVDALEPNTKEARRRLYERARAALVAETRGPDPALDQSDFLIALGCLEEAIQMLEAETKAREQRQRRIKPAADAPASALPRGDIAAASPRPAMPVARQPPRQFMPLVARAFRLGRDGARNLLRRPADRGEGLAGDFSNEADFAPARDNWLSDVLTRASRAEHENRNGGTLPRRDTRRNR
jgi:hypothetical protein